MYFRNNLKELRLSKGYTLEQLGKLVGVGKSTVRKWETGDIKNMRRDKIAKLADALGVSVNEIMGLEIVSQATDYAYNEMVSRLGLEEVDNEISEPYRKLFQVLDGASEEEIEQATKIIEALRK